jgi:hypothetical protein
MSRLGVLCPGIDRGDLRVQWGAAGGNIPHRRTLSRCHRARSSMSSRARCTRKPAHSPTGSRRSMSTYIVSVAGPRPRGAREPRERQVPLPDAAARASVPMPPGAAGSHARPRRTAGPPARISRCRPCPAGRTSVCSGGTASSAHPATGTLCIAQSCSCPSVISASL